jgi:gliding-associated putative ABC transporter substrate-binding component GldG
MSWIKNTYLLKWLGFLLLANILVSIWHFRIDLTRDKRYTLSEFTLQVLGKINKPVEIEVYLTGDFPLDFKRLGQATQEHLEELKNRNPRIKYKFIDPLGEEESLINKGMEPSSLTVEEAGSVSQKLIFPYALIKMGNSEQTVPLLLASGETQEEQLRYSIENLEYAFSDALATAMHTRKKTIAVLRSHGTLEDIYLYDILSALKKKYNLAPFTLQPENTSQVEILEDLSNYEAIMIAKPTEIFSEEDKLVLDQYIMQGGKTFWMIDHTTAEMDSLMNDGSSLVMVRDLNLTDLLFSYGVRVNHDLVEDLYSSKIALATGEVGGKVQYDNFLWYYYPIVLSNDSLPVTKGLEPVRLKFPASIDTLVGSLKKTILLQSSALTKLKGLPNIISLEEIAKQVNPDEFRAGHKTMGVLIEGKFPSSYSNKTLPFNIKTIKESNPNKMIVISDGDLAINPVQDGTPLPMNNDKWTGQYFGNKDFILNSFDYLLDEGGLIALRGKSLEIKMLNRKTVATEKRKWQFLNTVFPVLLIGLFGLGYRYYRKKKYTA